MYYVTPDEARSDLFLSGAVYLFGPLFLRVLLGVVPVAALPGAGAILAVGLPLVVTVVVPGLLMRYRRESLGDYGVGAAGAQALPAGLLVAAPIAAAAAVAGLATGDLTAGLPLLAAPRVPGLLLAQLARWLGLAALAVYVTVKARDAFAAQPQYLRPAMLEIGRVVGVVGAVAAVLLAVAGRSVAPLLLPLGVAGAFLVALRRLNPGTLTSRSTLLTPTVLLALGPFTLSFDAVAFVESIWVAALSAGVGLVIGALQEARRSPLGALGLGVVVALFTLLPTAPI
ncbi:MAG: hypothetical protein KY434_02820 [Actinobacteria bacterium]|nr:hypothetical protein [Actinomycetota bacterium]